MKGPLVLACCVSVVFSSLTCADDILYAYEGDVYPWEDGWIGQPCGGPCSQRLEGGHFVLQWTDPRTAPYRHRITVPPDADPPSLWAEWNFRSNFPLGPVFYGCDGFFHVDYAFLEDATDMNSDAAISFSGDYFVIGLEPSEFHTYRFESPDGMNYWFSVDGLVYMGAVIDFQYNGYSSVYFSGHGGCTGDEQPLIINEWDFVRYGTLSDGEEVVSSDPPGGFVDARIHAPLDRFTITFDQPGYVYIDDVGVVVDGSSKPEVIVTRRRDNGSPDEVEIVLNRPIPFDATTFFHFATGHPQPQILSFTFAPGDTDGDGDADLADFSYLANCFSESPLESGPCLVLDANADHTVDAADYASFFALLRH